MTEIEIASVLVYFAVVSATTIILYRKTKQAQSSGVWVWGAATAAIGIGVILLVVFGWPQPVYYRVKDASSAVGAVVAASGLAWSWFYQTANKEKSDSDLLKQLASDVKEIKALLKKK
ncbi:MAG: hypothetical protein U1A77_25805 [Pirellulales bacterium]